MFLLNLYQSNPLAAIFWVATILIAITVHEAAHSWTAARLGDPTPGLAGRVTLNPAAHLDPLGTLLIFLVGFGWGRPAPFNPTYFRAYKRDTALVAVAGPLSNLALLCIAAISLKFTLTTGASLPSLELFLQTMIEVNLILAIFNLIPIPPLDGSKLVYAVLPSRYDDAFERLEQIGPLLLLGLFLFGSSVVTALYYPALSAVLGWFGLG